MKKGLLCLSGGLDSATILAVHKDSINTCVFINYGSKQNERERKASQGVAEYYGKVWCELDMSQAFKSFKSALLLGSKEDIQKGAYSNIEVSNAKVPFRNGVFISMLVGLAESLGLNKIYIGVHSGDHRLYPDCTPEFVESMNRAIGVYSAHNGGGVIEVVAPFVNIPKVEIAQIAGLERLPVNLTYSCYNGGDLHCGECPTCIERREALGLFDTTEYLK